MKTTVFSLLVGALLLGNTGHLCAQIQNGAFSSGLDDWTQIGSPTVGTDGPTSPLGTTTSVLVQSTDDDTTYSISAPVATIDADINSADAGHAAAVLALPSTSGVDPSSGQDGVYPPTNGQAIYQTFTVGGDGAEVSFTYSFQTNDYAPFDSTGYVLDGVYTTLANPPTYTGAGTPNAYGFTTGDSYVTVTLDVAPGTHTLAFVAYNTNDDFASSGIYVTDVSSIVNAPEPGTWALLALGGVALVLARKSRRRAIAD